MTVRLLEY